MQQTILKNACNYMPLGQTMFLQTEAPQRSTPLGGNDCCQPSPTQDQPPVQITRLQKHDAGGGTGGKGAPIVLHIYFFFYLSHVGQRRLTLTVAGRLSWPTTNTTTKQTSPPMQLLAEWHRVVQKNLCDTWHR